MIQEKDICEKRVPLNMSISLATLNNASVYKRPCCAEVKCAWRPLEIWWSHWQG